MPASFSTYRCNTQAYLLAYLLTYLLTYLRSQRIRVLPEKLIGSQLVTTFPAFDGTRKFVIALTSARHVFPHWAISSQSIPHPTSLRFILILRSHLRQGLPSVLFHSGFPIITLHALPLSPYVLYAQHVGFNLSSTSWSSPMDHPWNDLHAGGRTQPTVEGVYVCRKQTIDIRRLSK
jgi:hypothetical protein